MSDLNFIDTSFLTLKKDKPFFIIGCCSIESREHALYMCEEIKKICDKLEVQFVYKSSYEKANRTSLNSFHGLGIEEGLSILKEVKETYNIPVCTDIHSIEQIQPVSEIVDILQLPSFLGRQSKLHIELGNTGRIINLKKPQFGSAETMKHAYDKVASTGNTQILLTERGSTYGPTDLVVDFRLFPQMKKNNPDALIVYDCTHSVQIPNTTNVTLGQRDMIPYLARASMATGAVDGLFIECHDNPPDAKSDAACQLYLSDLEGLLTQLIDIYKLVH